MTSLVLAVTLSASLVPVEKLHVSLLSVEQLRAEHERLKDPPATRGWALMTVLGALALAGGAALTNEAFQHAGGGAGGGPSVGGYGQGFVLLMPLMLAMVGAGLTVTGIVMWAVKAREAIAMEERDLAVVRRLSSLRT